MRAIVRGPGTLAVALAFALGAAPPAGAEDEVPPLEEALVDDVAPAAEQPPAAWEVGVTPTHVPPGGTLTLSSRGCRVPTVTVDSGVFDPTELPEGRSAPVQVSAEAEPRAEHEVTFTCDGRAKVVRVTIGERDGSAPREPEHPRPPVGDPGDAPPPEHRGEGLQGVRAGAGGGPGPLEPVQWALGAALVAGSVLAAGYCAVRRRGSR
ncbi:hypothetical protein [Streptomyces sp. NPDC049906]|uniref:hypothetical protein n=1 Tax=Streptomyces sp. NPDC049906 TaxID=3155656 RepID=UPI003446F252